MELARALVAEPKLLILDEPMAGMNQEEKEYIARFILDARDERGVTILLIEHHMDVVTALCDRVTVLSCSEVIAHSEPRAAIADPAVVKAYVAARACAPNRGWPPIWCVARGPKMSRCCCTRRAPPARPKAFRCATATSSAAS